MIDFKLEEKSKFPSDVELYCRTGSPYSLDEILFVVAALMASSKKLSLYDISIVARQVCRTPQSIIFKFLEYRPVKTDGTLDFSLTVKTEQMSLDYFKEKEKVKYISMEDFNPKKMDKAFQAAMENKRTKVR